MKNNKKLSSLTNRIVGLCCLAVALIIGSVTFISSIVDYKRYEDEYNKNQIAIFAKTTVIPKEVYIDNNFVTYGEDGFSIVDSKSEYDNIYTCLASETVFSSNPSNEISAKIEVNNINSPYGTNLSGIGTAGGGSIEFNINVEYGCYADIDIVAASSFFNPEANGNMITEGLTKYIKITINNTKINADDIVLPVKDSNDWFNFQHIILKDLHLQTGNNVLKLESQLNNPYILSEFVFPNINRIHVFADKSFVESELNVNAESAYISKENDIYYLNISGSSAGYEKEQLMIDLSLEGESYNRIDKSKMYFEIVDNRFVIKINLNEMPKGIYYPHFYVNGDLLNSGHKDGRLMIQNMSSYFNGNIEFQNLDLYSLKYIDKQLVLVIN